MTPCLWCGQPFKQSARLRGSPKKFCCPEHRAAFWKAARRWVAAAFLSGLLTTDAIKLGGGAVYASREADKKRGIGAVSDA